MTQENTMTALCIWEEVMTHRGERRNGKNIWKYDPPKSDFWESMIEQTGVWNHRQICAALAPRIDDLWDQLNSNDELDGIAFDCDFVPAVLGIIDRDGNMTPKQFSDLKYTLSRL